MATGEVYNAAILKRIFKYVKPYRGIFYWSIFLTIAMAALSPIQPFLIKYTLDKFILTGKIQRLVADDNFNGRYSICTNPCTIQPNLLNKQFGTIGYQRFKNRCFLITSQS